ncbi:non-ribosomal peptide synthase/polyketide synthase [Myxococcus stipitatus]|uniref:non-ribosomal peptide synthase/polyketide synthase n=1 Tax=Myxococcus stipitatus TaxID=83455 RepID=UPI001F187BDA|nr:non-ribosomal peptide synthetase [Myxococcus stipitatus]MCE9671221.1 non-ribosomal peptide synthase/polyketide synthase [Myxococcus stipitatus]
MSDLLKRIAALPPEKQKLLLKQLRQQGHRPPSPAGITARPRGSEPLPLSFAQQRLWFLDQLEPGGFLFNIPVAVELKGALDAAALERALRELVRRHEVLRTHIQSTPEGAIQRISEAPALTYTHDDLRAMPFGERRPEAERRALEEARRPFDLSRDPVMRATLLRLDEHEHLLVLVVHHVASDGWSMGVVIHEVATLYSAFSKGQPSPLPELPVQYADYAAWQREWLQGETLESQLTWWRRQLAGAPEALELPTDRPRPPVQGSRGALLKQVLPPALARELGALARREDATLFMTLMAAFQVLIHRYSGQEDIVVGTDIANRNRAATEGLIGFFVNQLVLRARIVPGMGFRELLARVRETTLESYAHQELPFEELVKALSPERSLSRAPLFQVKMLLQNAPMPALEVEGLALSARELDTGTSKLDLTLTVEESTQGLMCTWEYSTDLFGEPTIARMAGHYRTLLEGIVARPAEPVARLPMLTPPERQQILLKWTDTRVDFPTDQCLPALFEAQVERTPHTVAVSCAGRSLTYRELDQRANRLAHELIARGVGPDVVVPVLAERGIDFLCAILGILKAGGAWLPLDPQHPPQRLAQVLGQSGAPLALASRERMPALEATRQPVLPLVLEEALAAARPDHAPAARAQPSNLAYVIFTSGSTGIPKGAMLEHRGMINHLYAKVHELRLGPADVVAQTASQCFDISVWQFLCALVVGGRTHVLEDEVAHDSALLLRRLQEDGVTVVETVPSLLRAMLDQVELLGAHRPPLERLRWMIPTGEALPPEVCRRWLHAYRSIPLLNAYGPTECSDDVTHALLREPPTTANTPIGRAVANMRLYILDQAGQPVPVGVPGELYVGGIGVGRGYLNDARRTAEVFLPDPFAATPGSRLYRTGDLARFLADGNIEFLGRVDHQVKVRGFRIEMGEIEAVLGTHPAVKQTIVLAREDVPGTRWLVAYVVAAPGQEPRAETLRDFLGERLPEYMVPAAFVMLPAMPLTSNGKVDRKALPAPEGQGTRASAYVAPRTEVEELLAGIWARVLGRERVGIHDNFFELGGDSIISLQIIARATQAGLRLSPRQLFQHQTLAELARVAGEAHETRVAHVPVTGPAPLLPIQRSFLARGLPQAHHYNQAVLLETLEPLDAAVLEQAVRHVVEHHDALRLRFFHTDARTWEQVHAEPGRAVPVQRFDLTGVPEAELEAALEREAATLQAGLELSGGPLMRVALFERGPGRTGRLLIIVHHLVVDGVSWRVLLEDLGTAYQQLGRGASPMLPPRTTSFQTWAERLQAHAHSAALEQELPYWLEVAGMETAPLPVDLVGGENTQASEASVSVALDADRTRLLLQEVPTAYRAQLGDVLLTALVQALVGWTGHSRQRVMLEGHGREDVFEDVDLSRTVGWFTSEYPVVLEVPAAAPPGDALRAVKETLRRVPHRGLGYGLLRHLRDDEATRPLCSASPPRVGFNYLGQLDATTADGLPFRLVHEPVGPLQGQGGPRELELEVNGAVVGGCLRLTWSYSERLHTRATIDSLARACLAALEALIAGRSAPDAARPVPSDFPLARLEQAAFARVLDVAPFAEDLYPLSPLQQGMLFHMLLEPGSGMYVEQFTWRMHTTLDVAAFRRAWQDVADHNPILRTAFLWNGLPEPLQVVLPKAELPWTEFDWHGLPSEERKARLTSFLGEDRTRGFEPGRAPLMRLALARLDTAEYEFVWTFHHLLLDGWSVGLLLQQVFASYDVRHRGQEPRLVRGAHYRDYIAWLRGQERFGSEAYWRQTLEGFTSPTPLPSSKLAPGTPATSRDMAHLGLELSESATEALQTFSRQHHLTLSTLVQGAWALLLGRYSGEKRVVFGATVSGRPPGLAGVESMMGLFINTLPVHVRFSPEDRVLPWLRRLQEQQVEMREHEHSPLVQVQTWSDVTRGMPLFESLLVFENYPVDDSVLAVAGNLDVRDFQAVEQTNYPLTATIYPNRALSLKLSYEVDRFEPAAIARLLQHWKRVLEAMTEGEEQRLGDLSFLTPEERHTLLVQWNDTARSDFPQHLCPYQLFESHARLSPDSIAVSFLHRSLSYGQLNRLANRAARLLRSLSVGPDVLVPLLSERNPELLASMLAVSKAGGAFLPLDPLLPPQRLAAVLSQSRSSLVLVSSELLPSLQLALDSLPPSSRPRFLLINDVLSSSLPDSDLEPLSSPSNLAYVIFTSGSTGVPKGAMVEHRGMLNHLFAKNRDLGCSSSDVIAQTASQNFDIFVYQNLTALLLGARTHIVSNDDALSPDRLLSQVRSHRVSILNIVPSQLRSLVDALTHRPSSRDALSSLRWMVPTGEALPPELCREWLALMPSIPLLNAYGHTECSDDQAHFPLLSPPSSSSTPIGRPIQNLRFYVLDERLNPLPLGATGELFIGGLGVGRGYLGDPSKTAEKFLPDPFSPLPGARLYKTGDLGRWNASGLLEMLGRVDFMVKLRGFRLELGEVETALSRFPSVRDAVAVVRTDSGLQRLVAYVVPRAGHSLSSSDLRSFLKDSLPEHMVPSLFVLLDSLPLTPNGKVDRKALPPPTAASSSDAYLPPLGPVEESVASILSSVLKLPRVSRSDSFFDLGGHSLLATQAISRINLEFGVELPLRQLFENPSVAGLAPKLEALRSASTRASAPSIQPVPRTGSLPLSFAQQRLWFLDQLEPGSTAYNLPAAVRLTGALDVENLQRCLVELRRRHESLRTTFPSGPQGAIQSISDLAELPLPVVDLTSLPSSSREEEAMRLAVREAQRPFDLERGPLLRATLLKLEASDHVLLLTMHHIVSDGWSLVLLVREMGSLYAALSRGEPSPLSELPVQYADYAVWQRESLRGERLEAQLAWWRQQLAGAPHALELPTDRPRPPVQTFRGARLPISLSRELSEALQTLARDAGVTPFMLLLAAFQTLLHRYSGQEDLSVGVPVAGRDRTELEGLIGFFANTLVLRTRLGGDPTFRELLGRVRESTLDTFAHQDVPFEKLVEELRPERDLSRGPLFQVMFAPQQDALPELSLSGLTLRSLEVDHRTSSFDLTLFLTDTAREISGSLEFNTDLFDEATAARMLSHLRTLLAGVVATPDRRLSELPLLPEAERQRILVEWNDTKQDSPPTCIHELFEAQVGSTPDAIALVFGDQQLTYRELDARADTLAAHLRELGVGPDRLVAICVERSLEMMVGLLSILKAGGAYVPLDPSYPKERLEMMLGDSGARVLLTQRRLEGLLSAQGARVVYLEEPVPASRVARGTEARPTGDDLAYVIYTSGSTGRPKGVMVRHRGVANFFVGMDARIGTTPGTWLAVTSISFDISVLELFWTLTRGFKVVVQPEGLDDRALAARIRRHAVTHLQCTPSLARALTLDSEVSASLSSLSRLMVGGEALPPELAVTLLRMVPGGLLNMYGPTETTIWSSTHRVDAGPVTIGTPIANTALYILDGHLRPVPVGVAAELYIAGEGVARGYLGRPELTAERFIPDPFSPEPGARMYRTGDLARWKPDGTVDFLGRADHQVKVRGHRIELGEIEAVLAQHEGVRQAVVVARDGAQGDKRLVAYVVLEPGRTLDPAALRERVQQRLPEPMVPSAFVALETMPLTPNGKVDRKALPAPASQETRAAREEAVPPRTDSERWLAQVFSELLGTDVTDVNQGFFELGGHSLLATQAIIRARTTFHVELPLRDLFEAPTVAGLAARLDTALRSGRGLAPMPPLRVVSREDVLLASYPQQRMWFLHQLEPQSPAYNIPSAVRLSGRLDVPALERALELLQRRHEPLRTTFQDSPRGPVQVVSPEPSARLALVDLGMLDAPRREAEARRLADEESSRPFDLTTGPLLRTTLLRLDEREHLLSVTMHHIVSDGESMGVLIREVAAMYSELAKGHVPELPALPVQYADYAAWQREWLEGEARTSQLGWWRERLDGAPPALELPTDRPRPAVQTHAGASHPLALQPSLSEKLGQLCRQEGVTPFMALLATFQLLLQRYSGQDDICVGTPVAGRSRPELEGLVGLFINTLVLRTRLDGALTFRELLARVREGTLESFAHQDVPFERLVETLRPARDLGRTPLFQVMFVYGRDPLPGAKLPELSLSPVEQEGRTAKFELTLYLTETAGRLTGSLDYNTDLFEPETIAGMAEHFQRLLESLVTYPEWSLSTHSLLSESERRRILVDWNATREPITPACVHALIEAQAHRTPDALAVAVEEDRLTYRELNARANQLARLLRERGVGPDVLVGLYLERSVQLMVGMLGILKAGGAYVPLDPSYPAERIRAILEDAGARLLVTQRTLHTGLAGLDVQALRLDADAALLEGRDDSDLPGTVAPENLVYAIFTSGSTGRPKGVAIEHRQLVNYLVSVSQRLELPEGASFASVSTVAADLGNTAVFPTLCRGGALHLLSKERAADPEALASYFERHAVDCVKIVPTHLAPLLAASPSRHVLPRRRLVLGGDASDWAFIERIHELAPDCEVFNHYGPTETTVGVLTHAARRGQRVQGAARLPLGRPIANVRTYVLDAGMRPVPAGVPGELYIGGDAVGRGYLGRPDLTAERFIPDPFSTEPGRRLYRTGDRARYLRDGSLEFLGRVDHQLKIRGFRVELGEVEGVLARHPSVREVVVVAYQEAGENRLAAHVVPGSQPGPTPAVLRAFLRERLPEYMVPSSFTELEALPLTPNGKVDRKALPEPVPEAHEGSAAPRNGTEELLSSIWADVLRTERFGIHDRFFDLGGHSLMATQVVSRVREVFGVELPIAALFESPTVAGLAERIQTRRSLAEGEMPPPALRAVPREGDLPLSFAQQRLWFLHQMEPQSPFYNMPVAVRLTGELQPDTVRRCLEELVRRHEGLRTTFRMSGQTPVQVIAPPTVPSLEVVDLSGLTPGRREEEARRLAGEEARRPFDLARGPLFRVGLLRLDAHEHLLLLTLHHVITDGWSMSVLVREVAELYQSLAAGQPSPLAALPVQYADYARWQRQWLTGPVLERQLTYWRQRLAGAPPHLELPTDHPRPPVQSFRGTTYQGLLLEGPQAEALRTLCRRESVTPFMALMAAFQTLLHRYTGETDVVVGTDIANRNHSGTEGLLGFFVNQLVMRGDLGGDPTFRALLGQTRQRALEAYAHQDLPFEELVKALNPERSLGYSPLFQVKLILQNAPASELRLPGLTLREEGGSTGAAKFDMTWVVTDTPEGLECLCEYSTDLYERATIERMMGHLGALLVGAVARPDEPLSRLPLLTGPEREQVLVTWNDTATPFPADRCAHQLFEEQAARTPDAVAVTFEGRQLTYRELDARANQLARYLHQRGVGPEVRVGLCVERSLELVVGILGILKAGGAWLPLDPSYPVDRLVLMMRDAAIPVLVTQEHLADELPSVGGLLVCLDTDWPDISTQSEEPLQVEMSADNLAYIIFTSGSTGRPKGTLLAHRGLCNTALAAARTHGVRPDSRVLQFAAIGFDASVCEVFSTLLAGARLCLASRDAMMPGAPLQELLSSSGITTVTLTPSVLAQLDPKALPALETVISAGEACTPELARRWLEGRRFINAYGPTEVTVCATLEDAVEPERLSIGRAWPNVRLYVLDAGMQPLPVGVPGELYVGGVGVARGYLDRPELTAERFVADPFGSVPGARLYRTGDRVRWMRDGRLEFLGRLDHQVKLRGFRIELGEIEAALAEQPTVKDAVVLVREEAQGRKQLVAYLVAEEDEPPEPESLRRALEARLPDYMVPAVFVVLESLPLTRSGKVDREALPALARQQQQQQPGEDTYEAPRTPVERTLADIWASVLSRERVGIHDNFFELGGDSIVSIQVIARAMEAGLHIGPRQFFQHQTIAQLAPEVGQVRRVRGEQGVVTGLVPLTPIQRWFFGRELPAPHHYNQAVMLEPGEPLDAAMLERALRELREHHDILRARFARGEGGWTQELFAPEQVEVLSRVDLSSVPGERRREALEAEAARVQGSLDLEKGPLVRATLFHRGPGTPELLLIVIHHLVVDTVSWRTLLEDLETVYGQLRRGAPVQLPAKSTSFRHWAERLVEHARTPGLEQEAGYWLAPARRQVHPLPVDLPGGENTVASARTVSVSLDVAQTQLLLQEVLAAWRVQINDVLLAALAVGLNRWTGERRVLVDLEGHGREELVEDVDLTRTVGWFTAAWPLLLEVPEEADAGATLLAVKEQSRQVPQRGVGYGLLRYLRDDAVAEQLRAMPRAGVSFNYLGRLDAGRSQSALFTLSREPTGPAHAESGLRTHLLEINGHVLEGRLELTFRYSGNLHREERIRTLAEDYVSALRTLIARRQDADVARRTPSDFPLATSLTGESLARLLRHHPDAEDLYPLSPLQQGMLFHALLSPTSGAYVEQVGWTFQTEVDVPAFQHAWREVIRRNALLRTAFHWEGVTEPLQVVRPLQELPWHEEDWSGLTPEEQRARWEVLLVEDRTRGFDLMRAPLMRLTWLRLDGQRHRLLWSFHHLLLDGWSVGLLLEELFSCYSALASERPPPPTVRPPYRDYIAWLSEQDLGQSEDWWRQTLAGLTAPTPLPAARPAPTSGTAPIDNRDRELEVPTEEVEVLQTFARRNQLTMNTLVQAAWALVLGRYSGEQDVVFGVTVSGRPPELEGIESMVGLLINSLPARVRLPPDAPLVPWLKELQARQFEMRQHEHSPLVQVQGWSGMPRGTSLFESLFVFENYPMDVSLEERARALGVGEFQAREQTHYPIIAVAGLAPGGALALKLSYEVSRYDDAAVERLLAHWRRALWGVATSQAPTLGRVPLLEDAERRRLLETWNATRADYPREACVHHLFEAQAARTPDAVAVTFGDERLTYRELDARANQLAAYLRRQGVGPESRVGLCMQRSTEVVVALLGVLKAGGAYLPMDPTYPRERLAYMARDSAVRVVLTQSWLVGELPAGDARVLSLDTERETLSREDASPVISGVGPTNVAYVIYTSGSTGRPKGVLIEHRGVVNYLTWCVEAYRVASGSGAPVHSSLSFDLTVTSLIAPLVSGRPAVLVPEEEQVEALAAALRAGADYSLVKLTPTHLQLLSQQLGPNEAAGRTRAFVIGGEALSAESLAFWRTHAPATRLINEYGPTETVVGCCVHEVAAGDPAQGNVLIGQPIANTRLYVLDGRMELLPVGVPGELFIGGDCVGRGYLHRPELTAERFVPDPFSSEPGARMYRTGDLVRRMPDGNLDFLGRMDEQVKVRGFRIELGEVESALAAHPSVRANVVVAREDAAGGRRLVAYVVPGPGQPLEPNALRTFLREQLPEYMVPSAFVVMDEIPITPNGKVDRKALPAPEGREAGAVAGELPRDVLELRLVELWEEVLGVRAVGVRTSFFEAGGHSLLAVRLMSRIRETFGRALPLSELFQGATVEHLASLLREGAGQTRSPVVTLRRGEGRPFFCVHPVSGNVLAYASLARRLGPGVPFHGLQAPGLDGSQPPRESVEELAALYVDAVREVQPTGPYRLGGWSMGGAVCFEMARLLRARGEQVEALVLIDSHARAAEMLGPDLSTLASRWFAETVAQHVGVAVSLPEHLPPTPEAVLELLLEEGRKADVLPPGLGREQLHAMLRVFESNLRAHARYVPSPYDGRITLLRVSASSPDEGLEPDYGWGALTTGGVDIHTLSGDHQGLMREPHVGELARQLEQLLSPTAR